MRSKAGRTSGTNFDDVLMTIGGRIRKLRTARKWSQEELAKMCGLHRSHMGEVERGEINLTLATLFTITRVLDTTLPKIFRGIE